MRQSFVQSWHVLLLTRQMMRLSHEVRSDFAPTALSRPNGHILVATRADGTMRPVSGGTLSQAE